MEIHKYRKLFPYIALLVLLVISALTWQHFEKAAMEREERYYNEYVNNVVKDVIEQLDQHKMILQAGAVLFPDTMRNIDFHIYDGPEVSPEALMYYSHVSLGTPGNEHRSLFTSENILDLYGHQWTMFFETTSVFEAIVDQYTPKFILAAILLISLLLFFYLWTLVNTGDRAHYLARKMTSTLKESENRYRSLTENITDVIWTVDQEGRLTYISPAIEQLLGFTPEEIMDMPIHEIIVREDYDVITARLEEELAKPPAERAHFIFLQACCKTKHNRLVQVELNASWIQDGQGNAIGVQGSTRDITERKQSEDETRNQAQRAKALLQIASHLNTELELDKVKNIICEEACSALNMQITAFLRYDNRTRFFHFDTSYGLHEEMAEVFEPLSLENVENLINKQGKTSLISELSAVSELPFAQTLLSHGLNIYAYSLVERDGLLLGVLIIVDDKKAALSEDNIELLSGLANQAASAITNARQFGEAKNRLNQVQALRHIDLAITGSLDLQVTFQVVLDEVTNMLQTDAAAILRVNSQTGTLKYEHWRGFQSEDIDRIIIQLSEKGIGRVVIDRESVHIKEQSGRHFDPQVVDVFLKDIGDPILQLDSNSACI